MRHRDMLRIRAHSGSFLAVPSASDVLGIFALWVAAHMCTQRQVQRVEVFCVCHQLGANTC